MGPLQQQQKNESELQKESNEGMRQMKFYRTISSQTKMKEFRTQQVLFYQQPTNCLCTLMLDSVRTSRLLAYPLAPSNLLWPGYDFCHLIPRGLLLDTWSAQLRLARFMKRAAQGRTNILTFHPRKGRRLPWKSRVAKMCKLWFVSVIPLQSTQSQNSQRWWVVTKTSRLFSNIILKVNNWSVVTLPLRWKFVMSLQ